MSYRIYHTDGKFWAMEFETEKDAAKFVKTIKPRSTRDRLVIVPPGRKVFVQYVFADYMRNQKGMVTDRYLDSCDWAFGEDAEVGAQTRGSGTTMVRRIA